MRQISVSRLILMVVAVFVLSPGVFSQTIEYERGRFRNILVWVKDDVKKHYFDPTLKGIDIEAKYKEAEKKIRSAESIGQLNGIIAQFLLDFDDSHLFFLPPRQAFRAKYGFSFRMVGEKCLVVFVDPKSDAAKKGMERGDEILSIEGFEPTRDDLWKIQYYYFVLRVGFPLKLTISKLDGTTKELVAEPDITPVRRVRGEGEDLNTLIRESVSASIASTEQHFNTSLDQVFIWRMPSFSLAPGKVDEVMGRARKFPAIIFDLRGNPGGRVDMLLRLVGNLFPQDIKIGDERTRKEEKPVIAKTIGSQAYQGKVIVLVDSVSASASEVLARVVQLEKRGTVIGDQTSGSVVKSRVYSREMGANTVIFFGTSITVADLIMSDGKRLEKVGVVPDIFLVPSGKELVDHDDIVLAKALEIVGVKISGVQAGKLFAKEVF